MYYNYDNTKIINVLLFIIQSLGGKTEVVRLMRIIYQADITHLNRYGSLITGDSYMAMKNGPVPFYIFLIYQKLLTNDTRINFENNIYEYFQLEGDNISNMHQYDGSFLSKSEVDCIFEKIREYKRLSVDEIVNDALKEELLNIESLNEIPIEVLAGNEHISSGMTSYIRWSNKLKKHYLVGDTVQLDKGTLDSLIFSLSIGCVLKDNLQQGEEHIYIVVGMSIKRCALVEIIDNSILPLEQISPNLHMSLIGFTDTYNFLPTNIYIDCSKVYGIKYNKLSERLKLNPAALIGKISEADIHNLIGTIVDSSTISMRLKEEFVIS